MQFIAKGCVSSFRHDMVHLNVFLDGFHVKNQMLCFLPFYSFAILWDFKGEQMWHKFTLNLQTYQSALSLGSSRGWTYFSPCNVHNETHLLFFLPLPPFLYFCKRWHKTRWELVDLIALKVWAQDAIVSPTRRGQQHAAAFPMLYAKILLMWFLRKINKYFLLSSPPRAYFRAACSLSVTDNVGMRFSY